VPVPTLSVSLVPALARPASPEPAAAVPAPPPPKPKAKPVERPEGVQATPEPQVNPEKPPPEPVKDPSPQPPPDPQPVVEDANPDPGGAGGEVPAGASVSAATFKGLSSEFGWYVQAVNRALYDSWRQPFLAGQRDPLEVTVSFVILRNGSVQSPQIVESSGVPALDRSTLRAVFEATLPPLPRNFRGETQPALVVFQHFPEDS